MSDTEKNLAAAFAGESQANRKYLAFAKKADEAQLLSLPHIPCDLSAYALGARPHSSLNCREKAKGVG